MISSLGNLLIFGAFFLASFIISIILMTKKQVASGILLLLLTLILPPIIGIGSFTYKVGDTLYQIEQEKNDNFRNMKLDIRFEDIDIRRRDNKDDRKN